MRILHVLDHSLPLHSGYTFRTLAIMAEQLRLGWEPIAVTGPKQESGDAQTENIDGWHFYRTPEPRGVLAGLPVAGELALMRAFERRLDELIVELEPAVVHAHSPVLNGLPALRAAKRAGIPLVYEVRAFWEDAAVEHGTCGEGSMRYRASQRLETHVLRRADAVTTICEGLRDAISARKIASDHVTVVPNAVDIEQFGFDAAVDRGLERELGLENQFVIGFVGSFYRYEGLAYLIQAMAHDALRSRPVKLLLVGGGPEQAGLEALISDLDVGDRVCLTGRVAHAEISRYYSLIDLLVYPRLRRHLTELVTPLKPLEAMAQGKLVAASDVGGHRELIQTNETGFLFEPESVAAVAQCVAGAADTEAGQRDEMRYRARQFVENRRTWAGSVAAYRDVYRKVTGTALPREATP